MITWKDRLAGLRASLGREPTLEEAIAEARLHTMTREEYEAQRRSWVVGNMLLDHPDMTREYVERVYDGVTFSRAV